MMIDGKKTYQIGIPIHWGLSRHQGRRGLDGVDPGEPALTDGGRSEMLYAEFKGFLVKLERA